MVDSFPHQKLTLPDRTLAYRQDGAPSPAPGILFLSGFFSDMAGTKASFLAERCAESGPQLTRFDYRGHGFSSGRFIEGTIGDWLDDAIKIFDQVTSGPQILVGSSMGGWIMFLLALARPERVVGLIGIAAAPDFTEKLVWDKLNPVHRAEIQEKGVVYEQSIYGGDPVPYTLKLIEEGRKHLILDKPIPINVPVRLIQGAQDRDVPYEMTHWIAQKLTSNDVKVFPVKDGDHRLSRPSDLDLLWQQVKSLPLKPH